MYRRKSNLKVQLEKRFIMFYFQAVSTRGFTPNMG